MHRQPIVTIMGHVDHGKTLLLDKIRGSNVQTKEAGGITQAIGASIVSRKVLIAVCKELLQAMHMKLTIPGLLFIDTPGHAAFTNLRKRGGNLADIAIVVIDINEGLKEQTIECLHVLREYKTPFVVALNKVDLISGWQQEKSMAEAIKKVPPKTLHTFDTKVYEIIGALYEAGFQAERFDRVKDHAKTLAVIPLSAKTGQGIPELLMTVAGLAQRYLGDKLVKTEIARGTVLEVKKQQGIGTVIDAIIYDGRLKHNDVIVFGSINKPIVSRIKGLFQPAPLQEMRVAKFIPVKEVFASTGVRIICHDADKVVSGMPLVANLETTKAQKEVQQQVQEVVIETAKEGVIAKADSLGSLEALVMMLKENGIPVKRASIGEITKKDLADADSMREKNSLFAIVLGFNVKKQDKAITSDVIYRLIDNYKKWAAKQHKKAEMENLRKLVKPAKISILQGYVFRQSNPAIVGVQVNQGVLKNNTPLMNQKGEAVTIVKGIQKDKKPVNELAKNDKGAVSLPDITIGRQVNEKDVLYSDVQEDQYIQYKAFKDVLSEDDKAILKEIASIKRKHNPVWGV